MAQFALHLVVDDVPTSITFYEQALNAHTTRILHTPDGTIATAELDIHGTPIAIAAPIPGTPLATPRSAAISPAAYRLTVTDTDTAFTRAVAAGATVHTPVQDAFWGVRTGEILDPSGHRWAFDQPLRDVPTEEIEAKLAAMLTGDH